MSIQGMDKVVSNLKKYMEVKTSAVKKVLIIEGEKSFKMNFEQGGRPGKWKKSRKPRRYKDTKTLVIRGALSNIRGTETAQGVRFMTDPRARDYAEIHQRGGVIQVSSRKVKVKSKSGRFAKASLKRGFRMVSAKAHQRVIPARPYMVIPEADFPRIRESVMKVFR